MWMMEATNQLWICLFNTGLITLRNKSIDLNYSAILNDCEYWSNYFCCIFLLFLIITLQSTRYTYFYVLRYEASHRSTIELQKYPFFSFFLFNCFGYWEILTFGIDLIHSCAVPLAKFRLCCSRWLKLDMYPRQCDSLALFNNKQCLCWIKRNWTTVHRRTHSKHHP